MQSTRAKVAKTFGGLNQNSVNKTSAKLSYLAILKISCKNIENDGGVGKNVKSIFAKSRTEILAILWIFGGFYGIKWLNWMVLTWLFFIQF